MSGSSGPRTQCLWRAADGRCANCKAKRFRHDALGYKDNYDTCDPAKDYPDCEFYKEKPIPPPKA